MVGEGLLRGREGEGIRGDGKGGRSEEICPSNEKSKVSHDETLNQKPPQNALKLTYIKVKTKTFPGVTPPDPRFNGGGGKEGRVNESSVRLCINPR